MRWFMLKECHYTTLGCVTKWECVQKHIYTGVHIAYMIMYTPRKSLFLFIQTLLLPLHYWIMYFCLKKCLPFMYVCTKYRDEPSSSCWNNSSGVHDHLLFTIVRFIFTVLHCLCLKVWICTSTWCPLKFPDGTKKSRLLLFFFFNNNLIMRC